MIKVQEHPFDVGAELTTLRAGNTVSGATALFIGTVREGAGVGEISDMTLEHYPGMTEKALADIEQQARERWPLDETLIIHRYGRMEPGEDIVMVIVLSAHRAAAFEACEFLMDWLKTSAPFWKLEARGDETSWVEAKDSDDAARDRWLKDAPGE
jgi:molybdopterin synthase catalytic subunit